MRTDLRQRDDSLRNTVLLNHRFALVHLLRHSRSLHDPHSTHSVLERCPRLSLPQTAISSETSGQMASVSKDDHPTRIGFRFLSGVRSAVHHHRHRSIVRLYEVRE